MKARLCFEILLVSFITVDFLQSKEEYEASVCLCGNQGCRGSYLNLTGEGAFQKVQFLINFYKSAMLDTLCYLPCISVPFSQNK